MLQDLGLNYRVIDVAAGDLGSSAARKFDIEAWVPDAGHLPRAHVAPRTAPRSRPAASTSATAPRAARPRPVATLNGTLATTRWIVAILETHQQADGSVVVPEVLRPYLGGLEVIEPVA